MRLGAVIAGLFAAGAVLLLRAKPAFSRTGQPVNYDPIIRRYCGPIPVEYIRALIRRESDWRVNLVHPTSNATGLMQIVRVVRDGYNKEHGTSYTQAQTVDPRINIAMGCYQLRRIVDSYQRNHPNTLGKDFGSRRWVELLTFGWNAGYSEKAGVGAAVSHLERRGYTKERVTLDAVHKVAQEVGGIARFLREDNRVRFARRVAALYLQEAGRLQV